MGFTSTVATRLARNAVRRGLTLFEVLIVITLVALLSSAILFGSGMVGSARLRQGATLIVSGIRLATTRANATGYPTRLVFDLDSQRVMLEASKGKMLRVKEFLKHPNGQQRPCSSSHTEAA